MELKTDTTGNNAHFIKKQQKRPIFFLLLFIVGLILYTGLASAAPDGYCEEEYSDFHLATWIINVDYELYPTNKDPQSMKITVDFFFSTDGFCVSGGGCQPDPDCNKDFRYVNAWIDWDGDYDFDSSEQVLDEELFWYDEAYQDWLLNTYEGDPSDIWDIIMLPRENLTGKSIKWYAFDSFAGGIGKMTVSKIITLPDDYQNDTWMRVNYGWLYNPLDPCEIFNPSDQDPFIHWEFGDTTYKQISTTPDLCINSSDISITQKKVDPKFPLHDFKDSVLTVTVHNNGKTKVDHVEVFLSKTDENGTILFSETKTINSILSEDHANITFEGNFDPYRFKEIIVEIDPENKIWETNESNNEAKTHRIEGYIYQSHESLIELPKTRVDIQQQIGSNFQLISSTFTDDSGFYSFWTNSKYINQESPTIVMAVLEYSPNRQAKSAIFVINETMFGNNDFPNQQIGNYKTSPKWNLQRDQDYTHDITFSGVEGGFAYYTLITAYQYHEKFKTAPSEVIVNINDDDTSGPYVVGNAIHLPPGKEGTTRPSAIAHEFTHIVENGWIPTYFGHNPLVPVEEGSCHWGSCISRNTPIYEFPSDVSTDYIIIDISNNTHTSNSTPAPATSVGCREEFQIAGTMWDLNETLVWKILRYGFNSNEYGFGSNLLPWPSTPLLFYTAYNELDSRSSLTLKAIFQSHAYITKDWPGKDGVDPDYFTETFSDQGIDTDGNGKFDILQVTAEIDIPISGTYILTGAMDSTNNGASNTTYLEAGIQQVNLSFFGENVYESQIDGPYTLSFYLYYGNYTFLDNRSSIYDTYSYSYTDFERSSILFTGNHFIDTIDDDSDGTNDQLIVDLELDLTESSYVKIYASLFCNDIFIDNCWAPTMYDDAVYEYIDAGVHNLSLYFNGESICASGQNGTYELRTFLSNARTIPLGVFEYTDFDTPHAVLGDIIGEYAIDNDSDGFSDSLNVNISVTGLGTYAITGNLYNETGAHILTTYHIDAINDTQSLLISFDGNSLRDQQQNGVYNLTVELYDVDGFFIGWKNYTLSSYQYTDFEPSSEDVFDLTFNDYGVDNSVYGYETLCIDMDITSLLPGNYQIEGYLCTDTGNLICSDIITGYIDISVTTHTFCFNGQQLGSTLYNGSYTLDLVFVSISEIIELPHAYITAEYTFDSFETTYILNTLDALYSTLGLENIPDKLGITIETYSTVPRYATVKAQLRDSTGDLIDESGVGDIWAYENDSFLLLFDGDKIYSNGIDGPYTLILNLYDEHDIFLDTYTSITDYYDHTVFALISLTGTFSDYGLDVDTNSFDDYLVIDAEVNVAIEGFCTINGVLEDGTGSTIATTENTVWLPKGTQTLPLYFNGTMIKNHGMNGPYYLKLVSVYHNKDVTLTDYLIDAHTTQFYDYDDFTLTGTIDQRPISIVSGPIAGSIGESLPFNASLSYDPEGHSLTYHWDFGDGSTSTEERPTHSYSTNGKFFVNLTVNDGTQDSYPDSITVSIGYPVADAGGPYTIYGIQSHTFDGSGSIDPENDALTYHWNFGDGTLGSGMDPSHTYSVYGDYSVTLIVNDGTYESTKTTTVTVLKPLFFDDEPTDSGFDTDNDGLFEYLLMEVDITNYVPQNISAEVNLTDSQDTILSYGVSDQFLNMSSYRLSIYFDGTTLFENRVNGPYFAEIIIRDDDGEILDSLNYTTTAYDYTDFQYNTKIDTVVDTGIDTDGNGSYDYLSVNVTLINYANRDISLQGTLLDSNGTSIDDAQETRSLTGNTTIQLLFDGKTIYAHGENGPYTVSLTLKNEYDQTIDMKESTTYSYQYTDFEEVVMTIWTVDDDDGDIPVPPADFSTITDAIDAATDGDIIQVYPGTYYESLDLNKTLTLLGIDQPLIDVSWAGHGIDITANQCHIEGFEITNAFMGDPDIFTAGLYIQSHNNTILNNTLYNNENGITLVESHDNVIDSNHLTNINSGLILLSADRNLIKNNDLLENSYGIIIFKDSSENLIYLNTIGKQNDNAIDYTTNNSWNSTMPLSYTYNGVDHSGYVGNYWDDHISVDTDNNGVYDTPYTNIDGSGYAIDYYPMVGNWPPTAEANGAYRADSDQDIQFNSSGSYDPEGQTLTYLWDFGDGNTSTEANPIHAYNSTERVKFYPELNVSDGVHTDTDKATVYINYPVAIAGGPYYGIEGESITLDGSASYDPLADPYQSYPLQFYWYPADGSSGAWKTTSKKDVRYDDDGEYSPYLWVKTNSGFPVYYSTYSYTTVYVNDTDPIPDFTSSQQSGMAPFPIEFTDQSDSYDGITLWEWDFDNDSIVDISGTDDAAQNPSYTYTTAGVYTVNLTVYEADGDMVSMIKTDYITVIETRPPMTIYVPDDYLTIQEAIDAGTTIDGDSIIVRDGSYRQNIIVSKELTIKSQNGSHQCQLFPQYTDDHMILINSNNVTINGFYMNGTKYSYASLYCDAIENITISDNWINDTRNGILFEDVTNSSILNNTIENCSTNPLYGNTISNISIIGNRFSNSGDEGAEFSHMTNCTITNNIAFGNKYSGILIRSGNDNVIAGNYMVGNGVPGSTSYEDCGLRILSGYNNVIFSNTMNNNSEYGLFLDASSNIIHNNTMKENKHYDFFTNSDNTVYSNIGSGDRPILYANATTHIEDMVVSEIILLDADYSVLSNVTVSGSDILQNNGIYARKCDNIQFTHVTSNHNYRGIDMTPTFGFGLLVGQDDNTFTSCTFNDNRFDGVRIGGDGNRIEGCDTSYNQNYGVYFYECSDSVIVNSTIKNNSWSGIYLRVDYTVFAIENNTISGNTWGIYCTSGDYVGYTEGNVTIEYNMISNNTADGIRIAEGDHLHTYLIQHNSMFNNDDCGLYTKVEYADLQITMNTIAENDWGISCENTYWDENAHVNITYNTILENNNGISITKINDHHNTYLLSDNRIQDNSINGIYISPVSGTINIIHNSIVHGSKGILCVHAETTGVNAQVIIDHNILSEDDAGIDITDNLDEHDYFIIDNIIRNNSLFGIIFNAVSTNNTISNNMIACNYEGIYTNNSETKANINKNIISNNEHFGINTNHSDIQLLIYNNIIINNTVHDIGNNTWNITKTSGQNIIGKPYLGGNYWSAYNGIDTTGDYLGDTDTPFTSSGGIINGGDYHPLVLSQELYLEPIHDQMIFTDTIRSIPLCSLGNNSEVITLTSSSLPSFCLFTDYGNGIGAIDLSPNGSNTGEYNITITSTDGIHTVTESFDLIVLATNHLPVSAFTYDPETPTTLDTIYFNSTSTDPNGFIINWTWDMGDGTNLFGETVTYQFANEGMYAVCLTVEDDDGFMDSFCTSISVGSYLGPGNSCDNPIIVEIPSDLNYQDLSQTTCERGNNFEDSNTDYSRGEDIFYRLDVTKDTTVILEMVPYDEYAGLFLYDHCPVSSSGSDWLVKVTDITSNPRTIIVTLTADNSPYYLMADSWPDPDCYNFDLYISGYADIGVRDIVSPQNGTEIGLIPVQVTVENNGSTDETNVPVHVKIGTVTGSEVTLISEGFEGTFPPSGWTIKTHDGTTFEWEQWAYSNTSYSYPPQGTGNSYAMAQDYTTPGYYLVNTSLYTRPLDLTNVNDIVLSFEQCFQDTGHGKAEVRTYSGDILEEILLSQQTDDIPIYEHITLHFDPSPYTDPSNVTIEFWYTDENVWSTAYGFSIDDVLITSPPSTQTVYDEIVIIDMLAGETIIVDTFPDWIVTTADTYQIEVCVQLTNDVEPANDCLIELIQLVEQSGNQPPIADAGGPYSGLTGEVIQLDGSSSTDTDGSIASFRWDLDNDGQYDDASGVSPSYSWSTPGMYTISLNVSDDDGSTDTNETTVMIQSSNHIPIANDDSYDITEDGILMVSAPGILGNDTDDDPSDTLLAMVVQTTTHGILLLQENGSFSYTPLENYSGYDQFTYQANDGKSLSNVATVNITIIPINDAPKAYDDYATVEEGGTVTMLDDGGTSVLDNDTDVDGDTLIANLVSFPSNAASFTLNSDGTFSYTHDGTETDSDLFVYEANDTRGGTHQATVFITVISENNPPFANFSFVALTPTTQTMIQFTDHSTDDGMIVNWTWDLGDGNTSYDQHPSHHYSVSEEYLVCLTVTDEDGLTDEICKTVIVSEPCYTLTITVEGNGVVQIDPEESCYTVDTLVHLTLLPDSGWMFDHWSGPYSEDIVEDTDGSWQILMNTDKELIAHFSLVQSPPCDPDICLPTDNVTMYAWEFPSDMFGAYRMELDGITGTFNVSDGTYPGWCVDYGTSISKGYEHPHTVTLYSSYDPPSYLTHENWSLVNYIINHIPDNADPIDVQRAIYYLINVGPWSWNYTGYGPMGEVIDPVVYEMVDEAVLYGADWCSGCGDRLAVICDPGVKHLFQITFIEVVLCEGPCVCDPYISLPNDEVTVYAEELPEDAQSAYDIELTGITYESDVINGLYPGWCVDYGMQIPNGEPLSSTLYSSYDPPDHLVHENWSKVNYVINHIPENADPVDVQRAIWYFVNFGSWSWNYTGYGPMGEVIDPVVYEMVDEAVLYGTDWCPGCGDRLAVICDPGVEHPFQITFIQVVLCEENNDDPQGGEDPINDTSEGPTGSSSRSDPQVIVNQPPVALAIVDTTYGYPGLMCLFDARSSYDPDGQIVEYQWDFDGSSLEITTNATMTHTFRSTGYHQVMLTVVDDAGATDELDEWIIIEILSLNNPPGVPMLLPDTTYVHKGSNASFTMSSVDPDEGDMVYFIIDWGDMLNETSSFYNSTEPLTIGHQWQSYGIYTVTVYASDSEHAMSAAATVTIYVDVHEIDDDIVGWLVDNDSDGKFDRYFNLGTDINSTILQKNDNEYYIDSDNDGRIDYIYNHISGGVFSYEGYVQSSGFSNVLRIEVVICIGLVVVFFIFLFWRKQSSEVDDLKKKR